MFQNFDTPASPVSDNSRLSLLRAFMQDQNIDAVIIPHADEQNNEYLPIEKERLAWISGFTGSAGNAIISSNQAILFVDGRYSLQAAEQTDPDHWQIENLVDTPPSKWIEQNLQEGQSLGIDPWLHSSNQVKALKKACKKSGLRLVELQTNPIDNIWDDQPASILGHAHIHDFAFAGRVTSDKMQDMLANLEKNNADICVLTDPASICWLFNIRGEDVTHTPIVLAHAILRRNADPMLFIDQRKLIIETRAFLTQVCELCAPSDLEHELRNQSNGARVMLDGNQAAHAFTTIVKKAGVQWFTQMTLPVSPVPLRMKWKLRAPNLPTCAMGRPSPVFFSGSINSRQIQSMKYLPPKNWKKSALKWLRNFLYVKFLSTPSPIRPPRCHCPLPGKREH